jgi:hypothetical protein
VLRPALDLVERTAATFAQAFLAAVTLSRFTTWGAVELAAIAGAYAVGKFLLVKCNAYLSTPPEPRRAGK